jgi:hypothetical protein
MELITQRLQSAGALDLLLLLHGARDRDWDVDAVCRELLCPDRWAQVQLRRLSALGLLAEHPDGHHRYDDESAYASAVDELARACRRDRAGVIRRLFSGTAAGADAVLSAQDAGANGACERLSLVSRRPVR